MKSGLKIRAAAGPGLILFVAVLACGLFFPVAQAGSRPAGDNTMLMFVGEELEYVSLASRKSEKSTSAPALVQVIDRDLIRRNGYQTLADVLGAVPGFYTAALPAGSAAYARGVKNGLLMLYDGVPLSTSAIRDSGPMDLEISLDGIAKVEIIRGPGSVLWGADAYAGIVNLVPLKGENAEGIRSGIRAGNFDAKTAAASFGRTYGSVDVFVSGYAAGETYHEQEYAREKSIAGNGGADENAFNTIDGSSSLEFAGNAQGIGIFDVSWRLADHSKEYVLSSWDGLTWKGETRSPSGFFKASATGELAGAKVTTTGYGQYISETRANVDLERKVTDRVLYGESVFQMPVAEEDYFTAGVSVKHSSVEGAILDDDFLPGSLKPSNRIFVPDAEQTDYTDTMTSIFGQYRHKLGKADIWAGARYDIHSQYRDTISWNAGWVLPLQGSWYVKGVAGTAYRTPYAASLVLEDSFRPEKVTSLNLQALWDNRAGDRFSVSLFGNLLRNSIVSDPYGGLSSPVDREIAGIEVDFSKQVTEKFDVFGSMTYMETTGDEPEYTVPEYTVIDPDGTSTTYYENWRIPYDAGPEWMISLGASLDLAECVVWTSRVDYTGDLGYSFDKNAVSGSFSPDPTVSSRIVWDGLLPFGADLIVGADNLFDADNRIPGDYGPVTSTPLTYYVRLDWKY